MDAQHVIKSMGAVFRTHGLLEAHRSDNGPPSASKEFKGFLEYLGINHKKGVPYWPQSKGEMKRDNQAILKIANYSPWSERLEIWVLRNFFFFSMVTPHTVTGVSPTGLLIGRTLRYKLLRVVYTEFIMADRSGKPQYESMKTRRVRIDTLVLIWR